MDLEAAAELRADASLSALGPTSPGGFLALQGAYRLRNPLGNLIALGIRCVVRPWPEKAPQTIPLRPRDHVHMQMGHALGHAVVDGDQAALRREGRLERSRDALYP